VCGGAAAEEFLHRPAVPVHQNLLCPSAAAARRMARGELAMCICAECGFVFNVAFDAALLEYGQQYDNTQTHSAAFQQHVAGLVQRLAVLPEVRGGSIVEVGCGKGGFLRQLLAAAGPESRGHGFDPAYAGSDSDLEGRAIFHRCFYDQECAAVPADVVVCRHVIEHVPQPLTLLRAVRQALARAGRARVFFETPCVRWILQHQVIWDFFYEHCSLFTADSLALAFSRAGFRVDSVQHVFGGQYLWLEATPADVDSAGHPAESREILGLARCFTRLEERLTDAWRRQIQRLAGSGGVVLWGGGAKGVTFANLIDPQQRWLSGVVDINPNKQGRFLPGSAHRILQPQSLGGLPVRSVVLLNPNYRDEVSALLNQLGLNISLVDLMNERTVAA
jgi:SAM-dependent methyltransferase